jgi:methanogenic corrinoid protein MtbC1
MPAFLNIAAVARRTGVPADTLRKWEQRYGVLRPTRSPGGHRRYSDVDVARVEWLKARLAEGYRIGAAAAMLGRGETEVAATPEELAGGIYDAIARDDATAASRLLDQTFASLQLDEAIARVLVPLLERIGGGWEDGTLTVAQEHAASAEVRARLERLLADAHGGVRGPALLACAPGERHELGLLMLALLLRADGWRVVYLGADTPVEPALRMAEAIGARLVCFSVAMREHVDGLRQELERAAVDGVATLVVGGRGVDAATARELGATYLDGNVRHAVAELRAAGDGTRPPRRAARGS